MSRAIEFLVDEDIMRPKKDEISENFRLLWLKVILRAAYDYVLYKDAKSMAFKRLAESARRWLFEDYFEKIRYTEDGKRKIKYERPFNSLYMLCEQLDLEMEIVRKFVNRLSRKDIRKLEFFTRYRKQKLTEDAIDTVKKYKKH